MEYKCEIPVHQVKSFLNRAASDASVHCSSSLTALKDRVLSLTAGCCVAVFGASLSPLLARPSRPSASPARRVRETLGVRVRVQCPGGVAVICPAHRRMRAAVGDTFLERPARVWASLLADGRDRERTLPLELEQPLSSVPFTDRVRVSHVTPRHATPRHATPRHATPRHATPRHATPRHATPRMCAHSLHYNSHRR
jgi:hypothetical protein